MNRRVFSVVLAALCAIGATAAAKELDQFTDRLLVLRYYAGGYRELTDAPGPERVDAVLDARMTELLDALGRELRDDPPPSAAARDAMVRAAFQHRYLPELITPYEEWVKHDAFVPLYKVRDKGIFGHAVDYDDMRLTWYIELSPIVRAGGVLMGIDKLGHFLAQGFQYYEHYQTLHALPESERYAAMRKFGHDQEAQQLGIATGGVYSYADLASNWAGMSFFLALFDDIDIEGARHARYFERTERGGYRRVRDFHWAEWVSPDWDEVLNPAGLEKRVLFGKVSANLRRRPDARRQSICEHYRADPAAFLGPHPNLRPRARYAVPELGRAVAPHALDVRTICATAR
jgi:hypothetical protein